jgi:hypothetical protein
MDLARPKSLLFSLLPEKGKNGSGTFTVDFDPFTSVRIPEMIKHKHYI